MCAYTYISIRKRITVTIRVRQKFLKGLRCSKSFRRHDDQPVHEKKYMTSNEMIPTLFRHLCRTHELCHESQRGSGVDSSWRFGPSTSKRFGLLCYQLFWRDYE